MAIAENISLVESRIQAACRRANRSRDSVSLIAVSKTHPAEAILEAHAAGLRRFGENRVQEFAAKYAAVSNLPGAEFILIGNLQSNKAAKAAELFSSLQSLDSLRLAKRLDEAAAALNKKLPVLLEIKLSHEESKHGIAPDCAELNELLETLPSLASLEMRGLMTVPPFSDDLESVRPCFRQLRELQNHFAAKHPRLSFNELSMGMSHDFEIAIEEGSTSVRIGTAIFGTRPPI
jgi:pyridoxal phosphate enzyme (YggS family)